jgi:hypothetical protein
MNMVHAMLLDSGLANKFWAEALHTTIFVHNCIPSKLVSNWAPYQLLYGKAPDISKLQPFSCKAFILMPSQMRNKLQDHSHTTVYLRPLVNSMHHHLMVGSMVTESHNVIFCSLQEAVTGHNHAVIDI